MGTLSTAAIQRMDSSSPGTAAFPQRTVPGSAWSPRPASPASLSGSRIPTSASPSPPRSSAPPPASSPAPSPCSRRSTWSASRSRSSRSTSTSSPRPATRRCCASRCCSTPARSPSPPLRSTPRLPRRAAPGTPASRRWSSMPCCAARSTTTCAHAPPRLGWSATTTSSWSWAPRRSAAPTVVDAVQRAARHSGSTPSSGSTARRWSSSLGRVAGRPGARRLGPPRRVRPGTGGGRPGRPRPHGGTPRPPPRCPGLRPPPPGPTRRARCTPTTCCPNGRWTATRTRGHGSSTDVYRPLEASRSRAARDRGGIPGAGRLARGRGPAALRARQHRALPAPADRRRHRREPHRPPRRLHPAGRPDPGSPGPLL